MTHIIYGPTKHDSNELYNKKLHTIVDGPTLISFHIFLRKISFFGGN